MCPGPSGQCFLTGSNEYALHFVFLPFLRITKRALGRITCESIDDAATYLSNGMSDKPIEKIIQQCRQGKRSAYKPLYKHYYGYVAAIAIRYAASMEEAEEIINDAFLKVFEKMQKLYNPDYPFKPWLRKVVIHAAIDYLRRNRQGHILLDVADVDQPLSETIFDVMTANEIMELVHDLPPAYRAVFNLYAIEGYKHIEIAGLLDISEGTSKSNLHKARLWLQRMMKQRNYKSNETGYGS